MPLKLAPSNEHAGHSIHQAMLNNDGKEQVLWRGARHSGALIARRQCDSVVSPNAGTRRAGRNAVGVILTGMGADGAEGLMQMRQSGSPTIGQDEASCVVYGMPKAAYDMGAVAKQVSLSDVASEILRQVSAMG